LAHHSSAVFYRSFIEYSLNQETGAQALRALRVIEGNALEVKILSLNSLNPELIETPLNMLYHACIARGYSRKL